MPHQPADELGAGQCRGAATASAASAEVVGIGAVVGGMLAVDSGFDAYRLVVAVWSLWGLGLGEETLVPVYGHTAAYRVRWRRSGTAWPAAAAVVHALVKRLQKTPPNDIELARRRMHEVKHGRNA